MAAMHDHPPLEPRGPRVLGRAAGRGVATRNLWLSIPALTLAFAVWMLWSVVVVHLPAAGFRYSTNQLFWLTALPALCGATLRIFYAFAVPVVGGRRFTALATASLLLPALGIGFAVQDPNTPYEWMVALALLCGLGGGNFASFRWPTSASSFRARAGVALGLNAGLGHLGVAWSSSWCRWSSAPVSSACLRSAASPQATAQGPMWLQNAGFIWVPFIAASALAAWFGMDDLADAKAGFAEQAVIFTRKHNWLMCWLYLGTFGSFIGFSAGLPMLIRASSRARRAAPRLAGPADRRAAAAAGRLAGRPLGGARVTFWIFVAMALGRARGAAVPAARRVRPASFAGFLASFWPAVRRGRHRQRQHLPHDPARSSSPSGSAQRRAADRAADDAGREGRQQEGRGEPPPCWAFASAIGAYGGFFIPKSYGTSIALTGSPARRAACLHRLLPLLHRADLVALQPPQRAHALLSVHVFKLPPQGRQAMSHFLDRLTHFSPAQGDLLRRPRRDHR